MLPGVTIAEYEIMISSDGISHVNSKHQPLSEYTVSELLKEMALLKFLGAVYRPISRPMTTFSNE